MDIHDILQKDPGIWDLFTRREEYENPLRDEYDRFPYYASRNRDIFEPKASQILVENGYAVEYPDDAPFAVCLTHDIDNVYRSIQFKGLATLRALHKRTPSAAIHSLSEIRSKKTPLCNFSEIIRLEKRYSATSTFFFMAENPDEQDYAYPVEDLEHEIGDIIDNGCEVGLHGGHTTYLNPEELERKKERLESVTHRPVLGYRNHFLRFRVPVTWEYLSQAGFLYDTTLGYADCVGFRNGMCHPFRPFNLNNGSTMNIIEIPLHVMDHSLFGYMRLNPGIAWKVIRELIESVENSHGILTILWHNSYMDGQNLELYEKILAYCREKRAWMTGGGRIMDLFS